MPAPVPAATRKKVVGWLKKGLSVDEAHEKAKAAGLKVSRATVGNYSREVDAAKKAAAESAAAPKEPALEDLPGLVVQLQAEVAFLRQRLEHMETTGVPKMSLAEVATLAVQVAMNNARDPSNESAVRVRWIGELPGLMAEARKVREAEGQEDGDDSDLFDPGKPAAPAGPAGSASA